MTTWSEKLDTYGCGELMGTTGAQGAARPAFADREWLPTEADERAAWELYTEVRTRSTTQPLAHRHGDEEAALTSVHALFGLTRTAIKDYPNCTHFATLAVHVLNVHVRPFTSDWHRVKLAGRFGSRDTCHHFRRELAAVQGKLRDFMRLLGGIAERDGFTGGTESGLEARDVYPDYELGTDIEFGVAGSRMTIANAAVIDEAERREVLARRKTYGLGKKSENAVGLALSGGGIRSATFSLGIAQVLARKGILKQVDFVSTVSGGGYLGSFLSAYLNDPDNPHTGLDPERHERPFGRRGEVESKPVRHLRNHSKYMAEGGLKARALALGLMLYGIAVNLIMASPFILLAVVVARYTLGDAFEVASEGPVAFPAESLRTATLLLAGLLLASVVLLPLVQALGRNAGPRGSRFAVYSGIFESWWCTSLLVLLVAILGWSVLPQGYRLFSWSVEVLEGGVGSTAATDSGEGTGALLGLAAATLPFLIGTLQFLVRKTPLVRALATSLLVISGPFFSLVVFYALSDFFIVRQEALHLLGGSIDRGAALAWLLVVVALYGGVLLDINSSSPHRFYRGRLSRTYLRRSRENSEESEHVDAQLLSGLTQPGKSGQVKAPYHLINCALNIPSCLDPNLRGRASDFFVFSKHFCGSPILGYTSTSEWEELDGHLDLGTAMAISAAAASPQMGANTKAAVSYWLAILNVRLNYWATPPCKPSHPEKLRGPSWLLRLRTPGLLYFFKELTGLFMDENRAYVNLSDGGHVENLALYELLRRRCKFIIAVDGEADPDRTFQGLLTLVRLAKIDLGVDIDPNLEDLRIDESGDSRSHFLVCKIDYGRGEHGLLLYTKLSMTGNESEFLQKYRAEHPTFPHESTADQLFDEAQFEAYRALGEHVAEGLFRSELVDPIQPGRASLPDQPTVTQWFQGLANNVL